MAEVIRIARFLAAGALNTAFGYAVYALLLRSSMPLWLAVIASMVAAFGFNFLTYGSLVFRDLSRESLPRFLIFYIIFAIINYSALRVLETLGIKPALGQALLLPVLAAVCYAGLRLFVFRKPIVSHEE